MRCVIQCIYELIYACSDDQISQNVKPFYNPDTTSLMAPKGQGCPRCGGMVFAAEQQLAKGTVSPCQLGNKLGT